MFKNEFVNAYYYPQSLLLMQHVVRSEDRMIIFVNIAGTSYWSNINRSIISSRGIRYEKHKWVISSVFHRYICFRGLTLAKVNIYIITSDMIGYGTKIINNDSNRNVLLIGHRMVRL